MLMLFLFFFLFHTNADKIYATVFEESGKFVVKDGIDKVNGIAWIDYDSTFYELGWDHFVLTTSDSSKYDDMKKAEAAGYLEGYITSDRILAHYDNSNSFTWLSKNLTEMPPDVREFFTKQIQFMKDLYKDDPKDPFNIQVYLTYLQMKGLVDGFNDNSTKKVSIEELQVIISFGDILGIPSKYYPVEKGKYHVDETHCSAIFKITDDFEDIFFGHNSWYGYSMMSKMFKEYVFNFESSEALSIIMSSYPGTLASNDDYIVNSNNIVVIETSLNLFNKSLFDDIHPNTLLVWQREVIAMRLANTAEEWTNYFSRHFSGTYANQWMALDLNKFEPGTRLNDGSFYILEELPKYLRSEEQTDILRFGYWPSYNVPFYPDVNQVSGYADYVKDHPESKPKYDYQTCARAEIFRRDQGNVKDLDSFAKLMRYNDYKNDPLSLGDPSLSISCRGDYLPTPRCIGAYDAKISSAKKFLKDKSFKVITGPTFEADYMEPFNWRTTNACKGMLREGMPDEMKFDWVEYKMQYEN